MAKNIPAVSMIVPCYNAENFIQRGISSIIHQTCPDWELILVDDGSTDSTAAICQRATAEDERVHFVRQKNQGVSAARNRGLDMAKGQYVMFMDSDDYVNPDILAFTLKEAAKYDADIVMVGHNRVEKDGNIHSDSSHWSDTENSDKIKEDILLNRLPNFVWGKLYKKSLWDDIRLPVGRSWKICTLCLKCSTGRDRLSFGKNLITTTAMRMNIALCRKPALITYEGNMIISWRGRTMKRLLTITTIMVPLFSVRRSPCAQSSGHCL